MLDLAVAARFIGPVSNGRTKPARLELIRNSGEYVDVVAKFSAGCDRDVNSLAIEAICAMLAVDLGLPIPEPFLVEIDSDFVNLVSDVQIKNLMVESDPTGFGSTHLPPGYSVWTNGTKIPSDCVADAVAVLAFDLLIQNIDRRPANPNCLTDGNTFAIFDHEIALNTAFVIGWKEPWFVGGLEDFKGSEKHIFFNELKGKPSVHCNLNLVKTSWKGIPVARFDEYVNALPPSWKVGTEVSEVITYLKETHKNIDASLVEVERILA